MALKDDFQQAISSTVSNSGKLDTFVNGNDTATYTTDDGFLVDSLQTTLRKVGEYVDLEIADVTQAKDAAETAANNAQQVATNISALETTVLDAIDNAEQNLGATKLDRNIDLTADNDFAVGDFAYVSDTGCSALIEDVNKLRLENSFGLSDQVKGNREGHPNAFFMADNLIGVLTDAGSDQNNLHFSLYEKDGSILKRRSTPVTFNSSGTINDTFQDDFGNIFMSDCYEQEDGRVYRYIRAFSLLEGTIDYRLSAWQENVSTGGRFRTKTAMAFDASKGILAVFSAHLVTNSSYEVILFKVEYDGYAVSSISEINRFNVANYNWVNLGDSTKIAYSQNDDAFVLATNLGNDIYYASFRVDSSATVTSYSSLKTEMDFSTNNIIKFHLVSNNGDVFIGANENVSANPTIACFNADPASLSIAQKREFDLSATAELSGQDLSGGTNRLSNLLYDTYSDRIIASIYAVGLTHVENFSMLIAFDDLSDLQQTNIDVLKFSQGQYYEVYTLSGFGFGKMLNQNSGFDILEYENNFRNFLGQSASVVSSGQDASIQAHGIITIAAQNFEIGKMYYLNRSGTLTTVTTDVRVGQAIATDKILIMR